MTALPIVYLSIDLVSKIGVKMKLYKIIMVSFVYSYFSIDVNAQDKILVNVPDWPPYFTYFSDNKGFATELIDLILTEVGYDCEFVPLPVARGNMYFKNGSIDVAVLSYKKNRDNFVYYNDIPIFSTKMKFVTRNSTKEVDDISQLNWLKFEFVRGVSYTKEINSNVNLSDQNGYTSVSLSNALKKSWLTEVI